MTCLFQGFCRMFLKDWCLEVALAVLEECLSVGKMSMQLRLRFPLLFAATVVVILSGNLYCLMNVSSFFFNMTEIFLIYVVIAIKIDQIEVQMVDGLI